MRFHCSPYCGNSSDGKRAKQLAIATEQISGSLTTFFLSLDLRRSFGNTENFASQSETDKTICLQLPIGITTLPDEMPRLLSKSTGRTLRLLKLRITGCFGGEEDGASPAVRESSTGLPVLLGGGWSEAAADLFSLAFDAVV